jgi:hypothetical protein
MPVSVVIEIILSEAGLKTFIPGFGPRKFVFDLLHGSNGHQYKRFLIRKILSEFFRFHNIKVAGVP